MNSLLLLAQEHYENFPVGSLLVPKAYREVIHLVYAYARTADDIADEGMFSSEERIQQLNEWERLLLLSIEKKPANDFFSKLTDSITKYHLSVHYFQNLLVAFRKDADNKQYNTFNDLLGYCSYSANPIGRLMLQIFNSSTEKNNQLSDNICSALQLTNFWQDISIDTRRNRFYIPLEDLKQNELEINDINSVQKNHEFIQLMKTQVERTEKLFEEGKPLFQSISKEYRFELKSIWHGGKRILDKIKELNFDTRKIRPSLGLSDKALIMYRVLMT